MKKDFDKWNERKKKLDIRVIEKTLFFREGEVWWVHFGLNIGFEINGKGDEFIRPVLIVKKYNEYSFLAIPLSTSIKINKYRMPIGMINGKNAVANLSQIKNIDSKRLAKKICALERSLFNDIKRKTSQVNFD